MGSRALTEGARSKCPYGICFMSIKRCLNSSDFSINQTTIQHLPTSKRLSAIVTQEHFI